MVRCPACQAENPSRFRLCGQCGAQLAEDRPPEEIRRIVTVVTSDLKGSTSLGERLDPESLREVLTRYEAKGSIASVAWARARMERIFLEGEAVSRAGSAASGRRR